MRRYLPTFFLLVVLLVIGGIAIYRVYGDATAPGGLKLFTGYVPTINSDPVTGPTQSLIVVGLLLGVPALVIGMGVGLAITFNVINKMLAARTAEAAPATRAAAPAHKGGEVVTPLLSDRRSQSVFWVVVVLAIVGLASVRFWVGTPVGYLPLRELAAMSLFKLPGEPLEGVPEFLIDSDNNVKALPVLAVVAGALVAGTVAAGVGLARSFSVLAEKEKSPNTLPRTFVDALIPWAEAQVDAVLHPKPRPRQPANWVDQGLLGLDVLLLLIVAGIVAAYVIPSYGSVASVDQAVEATKIAANFTPTPQPGPSATDLLQQEFAALPPGDATAGQLVFSTTGGCAVCHSLQPGVVIIGPSQSDVATRAATRKPGYSPELYIYESIIRPSAFIVQGFQDGLMPQTFKEALTPQQLADVVAYMMTLR